MTHPVRRIVTQRLPLLALVRGQAARQVFPVSPEIDLVLDGSTMPRQAARWRERGVRVYATAEQGAWVRGF